MLNQFSVKNKFSGQSQVYFFAALLTFTHLYFNILDLINLGLDRNLVLFVLTLIWIAAGYFLINPAVILIGWGLFSTWWISSDYGNTYLFFILALVSILNAYYFKNILTVILGIFFTFAWYSSAVYYGFTDLTMVKQYMSEGAAGIVYAAGFFLMILCYYAVGQIHLLMSKVPTNNTYFDSKTLNDFGSVLKQLSLLVIIYVVFTISTNTGLHALNELLQGMPIFGNMWIVFFIILLFLLNIGLNIFIYSKDKSSKYESGISILLSLIAIYFVLVPEPTTQLYFDYKGSNYYDSYYNSGTFTTAGILEALFLNFVSFSILIGLIFSGLQKKSITRINIGAVLIFIFIAVKYFDWFFETLDKSLFFISAGLILIFIGYAMEKARRKMIESLTQQS